MDFHICSHKKFLDRSSIVLLKSKCLVLLESCIEIGASRIDVGLQRQGVVFDIIKAYVEI